MRSDTAAPAISAVPSREPAEFALLVRQYGSMVFGMACSSLRDPAAAEEIAQEVFLQLHQHLSSLESASHILHWLRRVTAHRLIDAAWQRRRWIPLAEAPEQAAPPRGGDPLLADLLAQLVATLPPKPRMVVILRYQEDLDPLDIARVLDMPVRTVKSHLQRSLALLREKILRRYPEISL